MQESESNGFTSEDRENLMTEVATPLPFDVPAKKKRERRAPPKVKIGPKGHLEVVSEQRAEALAKGLTFGTRTLTAIENLAESWGVTPATVANVALARGVNLLVEEDATRTKGA